VPQASPDESAGYYHSLALVRRLFAAKPTQSINPVPPCFSILSLRVLYFYRYRISRFDFFHDRFPLRGAGKSWHHLPHDRVQFVHPGKVPLWTN